MIKLISINGKCFLNQERKHMHTFTGNTVTWRIIMGKWGTFFKNDGHKYIIIVNFAKLMCLKHLLVTYTTLSQACEYHTV